MTAIEVLTNQIEFLRLASWFGVLITINLFWVVFRLLGYEITRKESEG